jgi:hypothetical protein
MTLQHLGRDGVRGLVGRHIALAQHLAGLVDAAPDLERLAPVELSIVCFRYAPTHLRGNEQGLNALNKRVMEAVQASGAAFLTQTTLRGRFVLRACILHYATTDGAGDWRAARGPAVSREAFLPRDAERIRHTLELPRFRGRWHRQHWPAGQYGRMDASLTCTGYVSADYHPKICPRNCPRTP